MYRFLTSSILVLFALPCGMARAGIIVVDQQNVPALTPRLNIRAFAKIRACATWSRNRCCTPEELASAVRFPGPSPSCQIPGAGIHDLGVVYRPVARPRSAGICRRNARPNPAFGQVNASRSVTTGMISTPWQSTFTAAANLPACPLAAV